MLYEKFLPVMASVRKGGGGRGGEGGCGSEEVKMSDVEKGRARYKEVKV